MSIVHRAAHNLERQIVQAVHWQHVGSAGREDARQRFQPRGRALRHIGHRLAFGEALIGDGHLRSEYIARGEPRIHAAEAQKSFPEQPRARQHHERNRDFGNHQRPAEPARTGGFGGPRSRLPQRIRHRRMRAAHRRGDGRQGADHQSEQDSQQDHAPIHRDLGPGARDFSLF